MLIWGVLLGYPVWRLVDWLPMPYWASGFLGFFLFLTPLICRWPLREVRTSFARKVKQVLEIPLGIIPVWWVGTLALDVSQRVWGLSDKDVLVWLGLFLMLALLVGLWSIRPALVTHRLSLVNLTRPLRIVQWTDVHIGSRDPEFLDLLVAQVNEIRPDLLTITGDFIDQTGITLDQLAGLQALSMPCYFVTGNHERYEDLEAIINRLEQLGVMVLRGQAVLARDDVQIIGIDDADRKDQLQRELRGIPLLKERCNILLYHRPEGLEVADEYDIHLTLSGHTHAGQIVPFGYFVRRVFPKLKGWSSTGGCKHYVSEGTGSWGPALRLGTRSEVTLFEIEPSIGA